MPNRHSWWYQTLLRRRWVVTTAAIFVLLVPLPMWWSRHQETQDRQGRDAQAVVVTDVVEQGNDDLVSASVEDRLISFTYPGEVAVGDRVEVYRSGSQWKAVEQTPLWVPVAATALCWVFAGTALVFYPRMARRRGWAPTRGSA